MKPKKLTGDPSDSAEPPETVSGYIERHLCKAVRIQNFLKRSSQKIFPELLPTELTFFTGLTGLPDVLKYIVKCLPAGDLLSLESTYPSTNHFMVKYELNLDWDYNMLFACIVQIISPQLYN